MLEIKTLLLQQKFIPIFVKDEFDAVFLAECCVRSGCRAIEITCRRENVVEDIKRVKTALPELKVLAGSIVDDGALFNKLRRQSPAFPSIAELVDLGIDGLVSAMPLKTSTVKKYSDKLIVIPGVTTIREAVDMLEAGAGFAKFFDLKFRGAEKYATLICGGPFHGILDIFVTGGVSLEKVQPYLRAGVSLLGSGFDLILGDDYRPLQQALMGGTDLSGNGMVTTEAGDSRTLVNRGADDIVKALEKFLHESAPMPEP